MQFLPDAAHPNDGDTVHAVATAVTHVAMALDELKEQLEIANRRVGEVAAAQITETELGRLFVRAAEFADSAIAEAEEEARQVVADARMDAERILADARIEAESIIEEVQRLPPAAAEQVQATIDGFTHINRELIKELEFLRDTLQPQLGAPTAPSLSAAPPVTDAPASYPDIG
ncbi:MAG TPA: DivIVA domain-containing protein [Acidimicrobiales bacterium]|nr:DivIVA domain-containing protein [Acidimicrobiales bacterium]